jgi:hypothetical protein
VGNKAVWRQVLLSIYYKFRYWCMDLEWEYSIQFVNAQTWDERFKWNLITNKFHFYSSLSSKENTLF